MFNYNKINKLSSSWPWPWSWHALTWPFDWHWPNVDQPGPGADQGWIFCIFAPQMPSQDWEFSKSIKIGMVDLRVCWTKSDKELLMYNVIQSLDSPYNDFNDVKSCKLKGNLDIYVVY